MTAKMQLFWLILWTLGFIYLVIRGEVYFLYKSIQRFKELHKAYMDLKESKKEQEKSLK
jgi:hypothetical protein